MTGTIHWTDLRPYRDYAMQEQTSPPTIGMLCWEKGCVPRGLMQTETLWGSSTFPGTFEFPVYYCRVVGANINTILENPNRDVLHTMIDEVRAMETAGVRAITTSCGFNAIFQRELANAVDIPVFTSALLQVPFVQALLGEGQSIGVITAKKAALSEEHLRAVGIEDSGRLHFFGLEDCAEWAKIFHSPNEEVDLDAIEKEVVDVATKAKEDNPEIGAFVLECTDLPTYSKTIRETTGCPVFDVVTLINFVYQAVAE